MNGSQKTYLRVAALVALSSLMLFAQACNDSSFGSSRANGPSPSLKPDGKSTPPEGGSSGGPQPPPPVVHPPFVEAGKSFDLYVVMDKSGSLYVEPETQVPNTGSDVACKRFDALLDLTDSLRSKLNSSERVRLSVITFSKDSSVLGVVDHAMAKSRAQLSQLFRAGVCDNPDYETTNYERGISALLQTHQINTKSSREKLQIESVIFFSDGAAKDTDVHLLAQSINNLNSAFPSRVYGVLLGKTLDQCVLTDMFGRNLSTRECLLKVVGNEPAKLIGVEDANGLSAAWSDLVNK